VEAREIHHVFADEVGKVLAAAVVVMFSKSMKASRSVINS
jgi:hypothetical protein